MDDIAKAVEAALPCDQIYDGCTKHQHANTSWITCPAFFRPAVEKLIREMLATREAENARLLRLIDRYLDVDGSRGNFRAMDLWNVREEMEKALSEKRGSADAE